tara:strand:- start:124 stop:882 length:759 start_codon:yes stop_codon:yes gene_type:complete
MAAPRAIFSGMNNNEPNFTTNIGIKCWSVYSALMDTYVQDIARSLVINTPNATSGQGPTPVATNGQLCGSGPALQEAGGGPANGRNFGPAKNVGNQQAFIDDPAYYLLGQVNIDDYMTQGPDGQEGFAGNNFATAMGDGLYQYNMAGGGSHALTPGNVISDPDLYNVIMPSYIRLGASLNETGRRIHYNVAVGSLNSLCLKLQSQTGFGRVSVNYGGLIGTGGSWNDELTATVWLSNGYGLLKNGDLAFATE